LRVARGERGGGLRAENERLLAENARLRSQLEAARRAGKRQAAPFSKGDPRPHPRRAGRKSGADHGRHAHRPVPDHVDETIEVALPVGCPCCGGELELERVADQYQEDIPVAARPHVRRFRVGVGRCRRCGARAQGRHPLQSSDALGAAGAQVGPNAVALAAQLNKELGLPLAKAALVLWQLCGLHVSAGALHQALARLAAAAAPTYGALVEGVRASAAVAADETGWRVAGTRQWLWVFAGDGVTVYLIAAGRGYEQAASVLGSDFCGVLERDGWAPYRRFVHALHQSCLAHLLRRTGELIADSIAGQAKIPHALRRLLLDALAVRDAHLDLLARRDAHAGGEVIDGTAIEITDRQPLLEAGRDDRDEKVEARSDRQAQLTDEICRLEREFDALLKRSPTHPPNRRLLGHLANEREHLLTFLKAPGSPRPTGAPSRRSAPPSSTASTGAATAPGTAPTPNRC
jgi:transposase